MHRILRPAIAATIVLAGVLTGMGPARGVQGAPTGKKVCTTVKKKGKTHKVCKTVKPSDQVAQQLASQVTGARTDSAREKALLAVLKAIHVGVYHGQTGKALFTGMETSSHDVYFYDAELGPLAAALGRQQRYTLADLAQLLTSLGIQPGGRAVDASALGTVVQVLIQWSMKNPSQPGALVPLLVRDLGLAHDPSVDMAQVAHPETATLDPLQLELLALYFLAPIQHQASQARAAFHAQLYGICTPIKVALNPFNPNTYLPDSMQLQMWVDAYLGGVLPAAVGEFLKEVASFSDKWGGKIGLAGTIASALHGLLLAYGLKVESGPTGGVLTTHDGPSGHAPDAGKQLQFQARVVMQDKLPDWLRSCLHDAGYDVPDQGPVPNVSISWGPSDVGGNAIEDYGTVTHNPTTEKTSDGTTGPKGVETMTFTPKTEPIPDLGRVVTATGGETPRAQWGFAFTNPLGSISQLLFPMQGPELDWAVTYHKPRGYKFTLHVTADSQQTSPELLNSQCVTDRSYWRVCAIDMSIHTDMTLTGRICGSDPVGRWDATADGTAQVTEQNGYSHTITMNTQHLNWNVGVLGAGDTLLGSFSGPVSLALGQSPHVVWTYDGRPFTGSGVFSHTEQTVTAPLEEDVSCPDNSNQP